MNAYSGLLLVFYSAEGSLRQICAEKLEKRAAQQLEFIKKNLSKDSYADALYTNSTLEIMAGTKEIPFTGETAADQYGSVPTFSMSDASIFSFASLANSYPCSMK